MISIDNIRRQEEILIMAEIIGAMRSLAIRALRRMYLPDRRLFVHCIRRTSEGNMPEGTSRRYTAIALIGLTNEPEQLVSTVLAGHHPQDVCSGLIDTVDRTDDLGEVALILWAARRLNHSRTQRAVDYLRRMTPDVKAYPTVELAWTLSSLVIRGQSATDQELADALAERLIGSFESNASLFPHWPQGTSGPGFRRHIACFADQVYPIQALAFYYARTGNKSALDTATRCADHICRLQGSGGQWWWHYDLRSGQVVEPYPVYSVHQDAMAPMALSALQQAGGKDYSAFVERGLAWLVNPSERRESLIDGQADLIWRKIARHEPRKLSRGVQALLTSVHPRLKMQGLNLIFRPGAVDYETRPYHMGWLLYAWSDDKIFDRIEE